jgi:VIT1/CCC1 family predicted Fe2+/Mn2+ transporter
LGANDGLISAASLVVGVAAASSGRVEILTAAFAGWAAGAMSMAAGEFVSVSSQADSEVADLKREKLELEQEPQAELEELARIYEDRGLDAGLAKEVARQLMEKDALTAHARDELGFSEETAANPLQAAAVPRSHPRSALFYRSWSPALRRRTKRSRRFSSPRSHFCWRWAPSARGSAAQTLCALPCGSGFGAQELWR